MMGLVVLVLCWWVISLISCMFCRLVLRFCVGWLNFIGGVLVSRWLLF